MHWLQTSTPGLLILCAAAIAVLLVLIIKVKLEPFIALFVSGLGLALVAGLPIKKIVGTALKSSDALIETGFGSVLGHVALIIGLGTVLGSLLERSGAADVLAARLLGMFGERRAPIAMGLLGLIFGIPIFFDVGVFMLATIIYVVAHRGKRTLVLYAMPVLAGLAMTHAFLPPHPGATALGAQLTVGLGWIIIMGLVCGIPAFVVSGILYPFWISKKITVAVPDDVLASELAAETDPQDAPPVSIVTVLAVIVTPLILILGATFGTVLLSPGNLLSFLTLVGAPAVALTIAVLLAVWLLGIRRGMSTTEIADNAAASLRPVAMVLMVIGAGSFFGAVIAATNIGATLAKVLANVGLPVLVLAFVISAGIRLAQGSTTVAMVTTGGIIGPTLVEHSYSQPQLATIAIAIGAGAIGFSHVNDGGFWIFSRYFNTTVKQTFATWSVMVTVLALVAFAMTGIVWAVL